MRLHDIQRESTAQQPGPIHSRRALLRRLHPHRCLCWPAHLFRLRLCPCLREAKDGERWYRVGEGNEAGREGRQGVGMPRRTGEAGERTRPDPVEGWGDRNMEPLEGETMGTPSPSYVSTKLQRIAARVRVRTAVHGSRRRHEPRSRMREFRTSGLPGGAWTVGTEGAAGGGAGCPGRRSGIAGHEELVLSGELARVHQLHVFLPAAHRRNDLGDSIPRHEDRSDSPGLGGEKRRERDLLLRRWS